MSQRFVFRGVRPDYYNITQGGISQFITILHRGWGGGGSLQNPNLYYVINGRPQISEVTDSSNQFSSPIIVSSLLKIPKCNKWPTIADDISSLFPRSQLLCNIDYVVKWNFHLSQHFCRPSGCENTMLYRNWEFWIGIESDKIRMQ